MQPERIPFRPSKATVDEIRCRGHLREYATDVERVAYSLIGNPAGVRCPRARTAEYAYSRNEGSHPALFRCS
jgi:hypothetical protein